MSEKSPDNRSDWMPLGDPAMDDEVYRELMAEIRRPMPLRLITGDSHHLRHSNYHEDEDIHDND